MRKFIISICVALAGLASCGHPSIAQDNRGVSNLGMCSRNFKFDTIRQQFRNATTIRTKYLDNTFNPAGCSNLLLTLRENKPKDITTVILNSPGLRNGRLEKHEIHYGYSVSSLNKAIKNKNSQFLKKFRKRLDINRRMIEPLSGGLKHRVNPCLECDLDPQARQILIDEVKKVFPSAQIIDNPYKQPCLSGYVCEKHGSTANPSRPKILDLDGEDYDTIRPHPWASRHLDAEAVFAWKFCNNGLDRKKPWIPPTKRVDFCGVRDNKDFSYFVQADALRYEPQPVNNENGCKKRANWGPYINPSDGEKTGFTWKLGDGKRYAIALFPRSYSSRFKRVELRKGGNVIDSARYRGKYTHDGSNRMIYDFTKHPADLPNTVDVWADGICWQLAKPQFRQD